MPVLAARHVAVVLDNLAQMLRAQTDDSASAREHADSRVRSRSVAARSGRGWQQPRRANRFLGLRGCTRVARRRSAGGRSAHASRAARARGAAKDASRGRWRGCATGVRSQRAFSARVFAAHLCRHVLLRLLHEAKLALLAVPLGIQLLPLASCGRRGGRVKQTLPPHLRRNKAGGARNAPFSSSAASLSNGSSSMGSDPPAAGGTRLPNEAGGGPGGSGSPGRPGRPAMAARHSQGGPPARPPSGGVSAARSAERCASSLAVESSRPPSQAFSRPFPALTTRTTGQSWGQLTVLRARSCDGVCKLRRAVATTQSVGRRLCAWRLGAWRARGWTSAS